MIFTIRSAYYNHVEYMPCKKAHFDEERNMWCVEINTLEELIELKDEIAKRYSDTTITFDGLIITDSGYHQDGNGKWIEDDSLGILIYDDYLE